MNKEKQRIAIAEACGIIGPFDDRWIKEYEKEGGDAYGFTGFENGELVFVRDYLNDLNAINNAVLSILNSATSQLNWDYCRILGGVTGSGNHVTTAIIHATAAQRAEALLKALNLWEDSK